MGAQNTEMDVRFVWAEKRALNLESSIHATPRLCRTDRILVRPKTPRLCHTGSILVSPRILGDRYG